MKRSVIALSILATLTAASLTDYAIGEATAATGHAQQCGTLAPQPARIIAATARKISYTPKHRPSAKSCAPTAKHGKKKALKVHPHNETSDDDFSAMAKPSIALPEIVATETLTPTPSAQPTAPSTTPQTAPSQATAPSTTAAPMGGMLAYAVPYFAGFVGSTYAPSFAVPTLPANTRSWDVSTETAASVPVPSTFALVGLFAAIAFSKRYARKA